MYVCSVSSATGPAIEWAFHPEAASTGHYQRHLDKAVFRTDLFEDGVVYDLTLPSCDRFDSGRVLLKVPTIPPHEALDEEVKETRWASGAPPSRARS